MDTAKAAAPFNGVYMDNVGGNWSHSGAGPADPLSDMYAPAAALVRAAGLRVWTNGPSVGPHSVGINASQARPYLGLATFTTIFEMEYADWLRYPAVNFSEALAWPPSQLGGLVLNIPANATTEGLVGVILSARRRGLGWIYPFSACEAAPGAGCSYAELPGYWDRMVAAFESVNGALQLGHG